MIARVNVNANDPPTPVLYYNVKKKESGQALPINLQVYIIRNVIFGLRAVRPVLADALITSKFLLYPRREILRAPEFSPIIVYVYIDWKSCFRA